MLSAKHLIKKSPHLILAGGIILLSSVILTYNMLVSQFTGNNYFPGAIFLVGINILLICAGTRLQFSNSHPLAQRANELFYYYLIIISVLLATNAIQFTPFKPIDDGLIKLDAWFNINLNRIMITVNQFNSFKKILMLVYDSLPYQMTIIPMIMIILGYHNDLSKFYLLLLVSTLLGFSIYYFFPTIGPASALATSYFSESQRATGLKFYQIHHYLTPTTMQGGMIAFPSFHVIWAWFCVYLTINIPVIFYSLLVTNVVLALSCVLLGWHYAIDIVGSIGVILLSHVIVNRLVQD